jgi:hypothetical protein
MNTPESLALLACLVASAWLIVRAAIHSTQRNLDHAWAEIAEDFSRDEYKLLRRADRMMAPVESKVLREWTGRPYDHEREGL